MTLSSMTGFARVEGSFEDDHWAWEIRSVNSKNLDIRTRIPSFLEGLEQDVRKMAGDALKRGNLQVSLHYRKGEVASEISINRDALGKILRVIEDLKLEVEAGPTSLEGLLALKGVIESHDVEESDETRNAKLEALKRTFGEAIIQLKEARDQEGQKLVGMLDKLIGQIEKDVTAAKALGEKTPDLLKSKLSKQLDELLQGRSNVPEDRLAQEIAFLATKADIREEIDRLEAHCQMARELLQEKEPVGRKFDFLAQEFNRESNTLCSKSSDVELTRIGLELKTTVDQLREQVQNVE